MVCRWVGREDGIPMVTNFLSFVETESKGKPNSWTRSFNISNTPTVDSD